MIMFVLWIICVATAAYLVKQYRRSFWWVLLVAILPIAVIVLPMLGRREGLGGYKKCSECRELIKYDAGICPHCHSDQNAEPKGSKKGIVITTIICPKCKSVNTSDSKTCYNCGKKMA
ncbi:zinc ribbon domain-containing protein [Seleniivibrio woodruffii]|uniref:Double zinc ribbon protein n=1 Tax=Seleniivibrio woodruffii TaxID=1078050 RepID=A0A4R1K2Y3_9BACT|nr:zinc ribbon domain-containing protein [Seleniivibrio woodruffii]TCK58382.1 double zinc ribbon protein [Seleniivibrio woodruffii]TVZ36755.1 double zinc ribbon protein [Seleniivibrio woodruffii]